MYSRNFFCESIDEHFVCSIWIRNECKPAWNLSSHKEIINHFCALSSKSQYPILSIMFYTVFLFFIPLFAVSSRWREIPIFHIRIEAKKQATDNSLEAYVLTFFHLFFFVQSSFLLLLALQKNICNPPTFGNKPEERKKIEHYKKNNPKVWDAGRLSWNDCEAS